MRKIDPFRILFVAAACCAAAVILFALAALALTPSWKGLATALGSAEIRYALWFTVASAVISATLVMLAAVPVAYGLSRLPFPGSRVVRTLLYLPIAFPQLVLGLCLLLLFGNPLVARALQAVGVEFVFTRQGVVAAQFFTAFPYALRVLKSTFDGIDERIEFVSRSLGSSRLATFRRVSLPLARSGIVAAACITLARSVGAFGSVLVLAGGMRMYTETLPIALNLNLSYGNLDAAVAAGLLLVLLSSVGIYAVESMEAHA